MNLPTEVQSIPAFQKFAQDADHIDVKVYDSEAALNEFIAGFMSFYPAWLKNLYRIRWGFVRVLGMTQKGIPRQMGMRPEDVPMRRGEKAAFFKVEAAEADHYWLVSADEPHLAAYLGIVAEPIGENQRRFYVVTLVHYHRWTGVVYFNVIRPFHHIVVNSMARGALQAVNRKAA